MIINELENHYTYLQQLEENYIKKDDTDISTINVIEKELDWIKETSIRLSTTKKFFISYTLSYAIKSWIKHDYGNLIIDIANEITEETIKNIQNDLLVKINKNASIKYFDIIITNINELKE